MYKPRIIIDDRIPYIQGLLDNAADVEYAAYGGITHERLLNADAIIIRTRTKCDNALLDGTSVRLIVTATIGVDHIDLEYCALHRITVRNAPGCNASSVAQWVGEALKIWLQENGSSGCKIGIVGLGHVGSQVKATAERLGFRTMVSDPYKGYDIPLADMARQCRIITFHTPLTSGGDNPTMRMAGREFFANIMPDAYIINAARGGIVVEEELKQWLDGHKDGRCAIDCWENEPRIDRELLRKALIGTPHIAGYSADGKWNGTRMSIEAVNGFFGLNAPLPSPLPKVTARSSYDILRDSNALKNAPEKFEWFRGHYPERRE